MLCVRFLGVGIGEFLWVVVVVGGGRRRSGRGSWQCNTAWCVCEGAVVAEGRRIVTCEYCYHSDWLDLWDHYVELKMSIFSRKLKSNTLGNKLGEKERIKYEI